MSKEAMKLALEAFKSMVSEGWLLHGPEGMDEAQTKCLNAIKALEEALAKQEQGKPVAWSDAYDMIDRFLQNNLNSDADYAEYSKALDSIYTTPPQRKPLTDEDLDLICEKALFCRISFQQFARSIEAAHGIIKE